MRAPLITSLFLLSTLLAVAACSKSPESPPPEAAPAADERMAPTALMGSDASAGKQIAAPAQTRRFIAMRHELVVDTSSSALPRVFEYTLKRCAQIGCEVLSSSLQRETAYAAPSASLSVRMPPAAVDDFLKGFGKDAEVVEHTRESEDKTDAVIDTEARIQNLSALRDRLRTMQTQRSTGIKDLLEIERELASTQAQLDSLAGMRKLLANETEKVSVNIRFRAPTRVADRGFFGPLTQAWNGAGELLVRSTASLISVLASAIPWLLFGLPLAWGVRALWRRRAGK